MTKCTAARSSWDRFQLTSSRRGWQSKQPTVSVAWTFQLTSSRRGWHFSDIRILCKNTISTHILTKRMTASAPIKVSRIYFNSHPHEEDDSIDAYIPTVIYISTHILTKRMTLPLLICLFHLFHFNSHPHEEDDGISQWKFNGINISTHILTKRMTWIIINAWSLVIFQLTSSRRGWRFLSAPSLVQFLFQLTSSRRGWLSFSWWRLLPGYFNSHPHEEDDSNFKQK